MKLYMREINQEDFDVMSFLTKQGKDDIKKNGITTIDNTVRDVNK